MGRRIKENEGEGVDGKGRIGLENVGERGRGWSRWRGRD